MDLTLSRDQKEKGTPWCFLKITPHSLGDEKGLS